MEPIVLIASVVSLLGTYLGHVGDRAADHLGDALGEAAAGKLRQLYELVKGKVAGDLFPERALLRLEQQPDNDRRRMALEDALADLVESDPTFGEALRRLVHEAGRDSGLTLTQVVDAGAVAVRGDVNLRGEHVAGRDLTIG